MEMWKRNLKVCWFGMFVTGIGMSQIAPVLPLYIQHLGIQDAASIERLSGIAFGSTFIISAIFHPFGDMLLTNLGENQCCLGQVLVWL